MNVPKLLLKSYLWPIGQAYSSAKRQPVWKSKGVGRRRKENDKGRRSIFLSVLSMGADATNNCIFKILFLNIVFFHFNETNLSIQATKIVLVVPLV